MRARPIARRRGREGRLDHSHRGQEVILEWRCRDSLGPAGMLENLAQGNRGSARPRMRGGGHHAEKTIAADRDGGLDLEGRGLFSLHVYRLDGGGDG